MTTTLKLHELNDETRAELEERVKIGEAAKAMLEKLEEQAEPTTLTDWLTHAEGLMFHYDHHDHTSKAAPVIHIPYADFKAILHAIHKAQDLARTAPAPEGQHPDDVAVDAFAQAMKEKLARQRAKGYAGWKDGCTAEYLSNEIRRHVDKGDPVDVANFAMFLHQRGERITQPDAEPVGYLCGGLFFSDKGQAKVVQHNNRDLDFKVEPLYRHPAPTPEPPAVEDDSADLYNSITANLKSAECALAIISGYVLDTDAYPYLRDMFSHPSPVSGAVAAGKAKPFAANDCLMYLIKEADLDHASHREYVRDFNGKRYHVIIEREGKN